MSRGKWKFLKKFYVSNARRYLLGISELLITVFPSKSWSGITLMGAILSVIISIGCKFWPAKRAMIFIYRFSIYFLRMWIPPLNTAFRTAKLSPLYFFLLNNRPAAISTKLRLRNSSLRNICNLFNIVSVAITLNRIYWKTKHVSYTLICGSVTAHTPDFWFLLFSHI